MLDLGLGDEVRLIVVEAVEVGIHTVVHRCKAGIFAIRSHVLAETALLQDAIEGT